jgi:hypothetical protein
VGGSDRARQDLSLAPSSRKRIHTDCFSLRKSDSRFILELGNSCQKVEQTRAFEKRIFAKDRWHGLCVIRIKNEKQI